jgi:chromosomal replication initiator protein
MPVAETDTMAEHPGHTQGRLAAPASGCAIDPLEKALRAALSERLGDARYGLWFGRGVRLSLDHTSDVLEVWIADPFIQDWIQNHYVSTLLEAAEVVTGRVLRLLIRPDVEPSQPLVNLPDPETPPPESHAELPYHQSVTIPFPGNPPASAFQLRRPVHGPGLTIPEITSLHQQPGLAPLPNTLTSSPLLTRPLNLQNRAQRLRYLDDFVSSPGNAVAHAAARQMAQSAGASFNPLVIHGAIGLGKSHLLEGIGHTLKQRHPALAVVQLTAEAFTNSFLEAMRAGELSRFRARYRSAGGLILDDVHFLAAKRATQDEFLHTFNALISKGAPIVMSADQHPRLIAHLADELTTRLLGGLVVKLEPPDLPTRCAILRARAARQGVTIPDTVLTYISEHIRTSVRELEGALNSVCAQATLTGKKLDLSLARTALEDTIRHTANVVVLRDIERTICNLFQISPDALKSDSRARTLAYARMLAMFLARKHTGASYTEIGRYFGGRDHSTVIAADKKVRNWLHAEERSVLLPGFETVRDLLADLERTLGV